MIIRLLFNDTEIPEKLRDSSAILILSCNFFALGYGYSIAQV